MQKIFSTTIWQKKTKNPDTFVEASSGRVDLIVFKSWPPGLGWGHNGEGIKYYWALFKAKILCLIFKTSVYSFQIQRQNFFTKRSGHSENSINEQDFDQLFLRDWMPAFIFILNCLLLIWNIWTFFPHTLISHRVNSWLTHFFDVHEMVYSTA